jgi:small-conductance mechanosensitive channel/CRP-like cAMP-binding protein
MTWWRNVERAAEMPGAFHWLILGFIAAAALLSYLQPAERLRIRNAWIFFGLAVAGLVAAGAIFSISATPGTVYLTLRGTALFMLAVAIINVVSVFVFAVVLRPAHLEPPHIARDLLLGLAYIAIAITLLSHSGVDLRGIVATSAVITAVIGFSLQDTLGNVMGGMALQMERTIRPGDWIRIDDLEGRVKAIRWRQTSVETRNWDTIVIPNSQLMKTRVALIGCRSASPTQHRQWVYFAVDLKQPPTRVIEIVETALRAEPIPCVAATPEINCLITDYKNGDGIYAVRYWLTDLSQPDPTDSLIRARIYSALQRADIPLSIPTQSIRITDEKGSFERERSQEMQRRIDALSKVELFDPLTAEEKRELATGMIDAPFVKGEALTRQGAEAHWLYIIRHGEANVRLTVDGVNQDVTSLGANDYFGEMGLMTGEPRTATVIAKTDVKAYRLGKDIFQSVLQRRPELVEALSTTLARRRIELESIREEASEEALRERLHQTQGAFLRRIRQFFALPSRAVKPANCFPDKFGHSNGVIRRDSCKPPDSHFHR